MCEVTSFSDQVFELLSLCRDSKGEWKDVMVCQIRTHQVALINWPVQLLLPDARTACMPSRHHNVMLKTKRVRRPWLERGQNLGPASPPPPCVIILPHASESRVFSSSITGSIMSSQDIPVPQGPDRKRVLNVLAQRRYRKMSTHITSYLIFTLSRST